MRAQIVKKVKLKTCKNCSNKFEQKHSFQVWCSPDCGYELSVKKVKKKEKEEKTAHWKWKRAGLEKIKKPGKRKAELQDEINHIARLIDKGHSCISSGVEKYVANGGHFYSVGSFPALRYNLLNIFAQSVHDNKERGGNELMYMDRLKEIFGMEVFEEIESLKRRYKILKLSVPDLKEKLAIARRIVRELEKKTKDIEVPFNTEERISMRHFYNSVLNIYL